MHYQEREKYGNGYRKTYQEGMMQLLETLQHNSAKVRSSYIQEIHENPDAFRDRVRRTLGWPLTTPVRENCNVRRSLVATDEGVSIYRIQIEIQPDVWMYGILFLQEGDQKRPLVIAQHGGLGTPEFCSSFFDSENYNDMTRRILAKGVHVFCPQLLLWDVKRFGRGELDRNQYDAALKHVGSSVAAVELDGLQKCLDYLQTLPQVDSDAIGMIGLSYGGFYTLYLTALDTRIKAALCSCYFNDRSKFTAYDWTWFGSDNVFGDAEIAALVGPRKLWLQVGDNDELFPVKGAEREYARLKAILNGQCDNYRFEIFPGVHEFGKSDDGIDFIINAL